MYTGQIVMRRDYSALIFDCDGTLANSMPIHYRSWVLTLREYNVDFSEKLFYDLGGVPTEEIVKKADEEQKPYLKKRSSILIYK